MATGTVLRKSARAEAGVVRPMLPLEIRRILETQLDVDYHPSQPNSADGALYELVEHAATPFVDSAARTLEAGGASVWEPLDATVGPRAVWQDLRPSEAIRLMQFIGEAQHRVAVRCKQIVVEELADAIAGFLLELKDPATLVRVS